MKATPIQTICKPLIEDSEKPSTRFFVNIGITRLTSVDSKLSTIATANRRRGGFVSRRRRKKAFEPTPTLFTVRSVSIDLALFLGMRFSSLLSLSEAR
ncbi:hypothetical protein D3C74_247760 [compost metagenome]